MVIPLLDGGLHCGLERIDRGDEPDVDVIPLLDGGLHCGTTPHDLAGKDRVVIPLLDGGLHCGGITLEQYNALLAGHPAARRRAPLRLRVAGADA